jgi:hypothetical protein
MKNIIPVVMAGVLGIYGLIIAVIISNQIVGVVGNAARRNPSQPSARPRPTAVPQNRRLATASSQGLRTWAPACAAA